MRRIHSKPIQGRDVDQASCWWVCTLNPWIQTASTSPGQLPWGKVSSGKEKFCPYTHPRDILYILLYVLSFSSQTWGCSHDLEDRGQASPGGWSRPTKPTCPRPSLVSSSLFLPSSVHPLIAHPERLLHSVSCFPDSSWTGTVSLPDFLTGIDCDLVWITFIWHPLHCSKSFKCPDPSVYCWPLPKIFYTFLFMYFLLSSSVITNGSGKESLGTLQRSLFILTVKVPHAVFIK